MNMNKIFLTFAVLLLMPCFAYAQTPDLTVDELYAKARTIAFEEENYDKAREIAYRALERSPNYHGIRIFIARLFGWEEQYEQARKELHYVLERDPDNRRALLFLIDVESWSGHNKKALKWAEKGLNHYPLDKEFMLSKASVLQGMGRSSEAEQTYISILDRHPGSQEAQKGLSSLKSKHGKYEATISYRYDHFREIFDPWQFVEFQLSRQTTIGSVIGRVQYANRFATDGVQFNLDAYPSLFEGMYAYISGGYSESTIYPRYRMGLSLYKSLPAAFEVSAGIRYLDFVTSQTNIFTGSVSKYWGNYLFTGRTYYIPSSAGDSQSFVFLARRYFGNGDTYLGVSGGFGSASSDIQFQQDLRRMDSWSVTAEFLKAITGRLSIGGNAGFDSEEFVNFKRDRYSFKLYFSYRF